MFLKISGMDEGELVALWCIIQYLRKSLPNLHEIRTLCNSCIFRTLPYSESWNVQNTSKSVKVYSAMFRTLCNDRILRTWSYSELCHIPNFGIFSWDWRHIQNPVYLGILRHIQVYSIIIVIIIFTFFFSL